MGGYRACHVLREPLSRCPAVLYAGMPCIQHLAATAASPILPCDVVFLTAIAAMAFRRRSEGVRISLGTAE